MGFMDGLAQGYGQGSQLGVSMYKDMQADDLRRAALAQADAEKKATLDRQLANDDYTKKKDERDYQLKLKELNMKGGNGLGMPKTPGRDAADKAYAKDYVEWSQTGSPDVEQQLNALGGAIGKLKTDPSITGAVRGRLPDAIRAFTNPEAVDTAASIADVTQRSLRAILGAQFTDNEGKRIIKNAYDVTLPEEINIRRLTRLNDKLRAMAQAKQEMADYFERNGTITGYKGRHFSPDDLNEYSGNGYQQQSAPMQAPPASGGWSVRPK